MAAVRRALLFNAGERYLGLALNFLTIFVVSRILPPETIGVSVIGLGVMTLVLAVREFATADYLIQGDAPQRQDVQTAFSVLFLCNGLVVGAVAAAAPSVAAFYGQQVLETYLYVVLGAAMIDTLSLPIMALLRRDMAFDRIAAINTAAVATGAIVTILLAVLGLGVMSFAWAWLATSVATATGALYARPIWWAFRPSLSAWRRALSFGGYNGATCVLGRFYEALPQLVLGRVLTSQSVAFYSRASTLVSLSDRIILNGVLQVGLPAFAAEVRRAGDVKRAYLLALSHITALHWPALLVTAVLAHPIVAVLLGPQWTAVVPLLQIMAVACVFWFPVVLTQPILVALGRQRDSFVVKLVSVGVCSAILAGSSPFGIMAMAASQLVTIPFQMAVSVAAVRRHVPFAWAEVLHAIAPSGLVTAASLAGPLAVVAIEGRFTLSVAEGFVAGLTALVGWAVGLRLTRHPFYGEASAVVGKVVALPLVQRLPGMTTRRTIT